MMNTRIIFSSTSASIRRILSYSCASCATSLCDKTLDKQSLGLQLAERTPNHRGLGGSSPAFEAGIGSNVRNITATKGFLYDQILGEARLNNSVVSVARLAAHHPEIRASGKLRLAQRAKSDRRILVSQYPGAVKLIYNNSCVSTDSRVPK